MSQWERQIIQTTQAPAAIGTYSQAVRVGSFVFFSGQIPLSPETQQVVSQDVLAQIEQTFKNLSAVMAAAEVSASQVAKLTIYVTDLSIFGQVNEVMAQYFREPYPARAVVQVAALPKGVQIEIDAIAVSTV
jgi:reactive intermediate/imine deaminase